MRDDLGILFSVVLPCYREAGNLREVVDQICETLEAIPVKYELVVIDDGSPDMTWEAITQLAQDIPALRAAKLSRNFGKELALSAGLEMALGDAVIVMDADGQHPPSLLPTMIEKWREGGVDIIEAMKVDRGRESLFSKIGAGSFYFLWNRLSGFEMRGASDYKLLSRKAVDAYLSLDERNVFFRGMTAWIGFSRAHVPFEVPERRGGSSGWSVFKRVRLAVDGISGFSSLPLHLVTLSGVIFLIFSFIFGAYTLALQIAGRSVSGFATVILLLLLIGSFLMISLGIIGVYLARIYEEIKHRPRYLIAQKIGDASRPEAEDV